MQTAGLLKLYYMSSIFLKSTDLLYRLILGREDELFLIIFSYMISSLARLEIIL